MSKFPKLCNGYAIVKKNGVEIISPNFSIDSRVQEGILNQVVNKYRHPIGYLMEAGLSPLFTRPFRKRYEPTSLRTHVSHAIGRTFTNFLTKCLYEDNLSGDARFNRRYNGRSLVEADPSMAWGSQFVTWLDASGAVWDTYNPPYFPDSYYSQPLISSIDMNGSEIGPAYKHQSGVYHLFYDASDTPTSQGNVVFGGVFDPPEGFEGHWTFQVYIASSGGTGTSAGKSGSDGVVQTSDPDRFVSATAGFVVGDEGKYIKINSGPNRGIYKIPTGGYINGTTVDTDAVDINQGFTDESGIDWELVTGPIGEYFVRVRPYAVNTTWSTSFNSSYAGNIELCRTGHELGNYTFGGSSYPMPVRIIYDRGCCWWVIAREPNSAVGNYSLFRWLHMSNNGYEYVIAGSIITGGMPTDLYDWSDIAIDDANKLWTGCSNATSSTTRLFRIDPYPGTPANGASPALLTSWGKQSNAYTADGLPSAKVSGIVCDDSQAIAGNTRVWVFCGDDGTTEGAGGIAYTDNYGSTWKLIHVLHSISGETLTVANGSPNVTAGTSLDTKFAVGDWIRFGSDTRSYEVSARTATTMTLATNYEGTGGSYSVQKGALSSAEAVLLRSGVFTGDYTVDAASPPPCDYDSNGCVYWIPTARDRVCKWDETLGAVATATATDLGQSYTVTNPTILKVSRIPDVAGSGDSIWHDNIWIGCHNATNGGWVRIQNENFEYVNDTAAITAFADAGGGQITVTSNSHGLQNGCEIEITGTTNYNGFYVISNVATNTFEITATWVSTETGTWTVIVTRYHWSVTDNFPKTMDLTYDAASTTSGWGIAVEPTTGQIILHHNSGRAASVSAYQYIINMHDGSTLTSVSSGKCLFVGEANDSLIPWYYAERAFGCIQFADNGLGQLFYTIFDYMDNSGIYNTIYRYYGNCGLLAPIWICKRWNGSAWVNGPLNAIDSDIDFDGTPKVENVPTVGSGLRRVHDWQEEIWAGVKIQFNQNGGATPQAEEYVADETITSTGYYGTGKDNLAQATWQADVHSCPTLYRLDEPIKDIENMWTTNGGIDGGYKESGISSDFILFARGPAENQEMAGAGNSPYWQTNDWSSASPDIVQLTASLRIDDELELDNDAAITAINQLTSSSYTFVAGDIGKSIFMEGWSTGGNNGQFVIQSVAGSVATVSPNFAGTESAGSGKRWKLRNVPKVAYVVLLLERSYYSPANLCSGQDIYLYSSSNYGGTWNQVKHFDYIYNQGKNDNLNQENCFLNLEEFGGTIDAPNDDTNQTTSASLWFNLTDLSGYTTGATRRQYWKIWKDYIYQNHEYDVAGIILMDENKNILGRTSSHKVQDADNALFDGAYVASPMLVPYESVSTGTPTDDGDGDNYTDIITASGDSFYETSQTTGEVPSGGTNFKDTTYGQFTHQDIGKYIRINETGYADNGFHVITGWVSKNEVITGSTGLTVQTNLDWQLVTFGPADYVRFESSTLFSSREGRDLEDTYYEILDIPSNTTIQLANKELPRTIAGSSWNAAFDINRALNAVDNFNGASFDSGNDCYCRNRFGTIIYGTGIEFAEIDSGSDTNNTEEWPGIGGGISAVADLGGAPNEVRITTDAAHGRTAGENVAITGTTSYNGVYVITNVSDATHFDIVHAFVATETGYWDFYQDTDSDGRVDAIKIETVLAGEDGSFTAVANNGSGKARFTTSAAHGMTVGEYVIVFGDSAYDGRYIITAVPDTTHFDVDVAFGSTDTGSFSSVIGPGDYILLYGSSSYGRRVFEIRDIERDSTRSETDIRVTYDELLPEDSFTNWAIYTRRTWQKSAMRRTITLLHESS